MWLSLHTAGPPGSARHSGDTQHQRLGLHPQDCCTPASVAGPLRSLKSPGVKDVVFHVYFRFNFFIRQLGSQEEILSEWLLIAPGASDPSARSLQRALLMLLTNLESPCRRSTLEISYAHSARPHITSCLGMKTQFWGGLRPIMPHSEVHPDWDLKNKTLFLRKHLTHLLWTRYATGFLCHSPRLLAVPNTEPGLPARDARTVGLWKDACVSWTDTCNRVPHCWKRWAQHFTGILMKRVGIAARRQCF